MFDDKSFSRSKLYFNVQQLCRVFGGCIQGTIEGLHNHHDAFMKQSYLWIKPRVKSELSTNWTKMIADRELKLRPLMERVNRKREEVESLRDGVRAPKTNP